MVVLDAGVVIAVASAQDPFHAAAVDALRQARRRGEGLVLPAVAYAETLVHPFRRGEDAVKRVDDFLAQMPIRLAPVDEAVARAAARLRAAHRTLRMPDALVIATAVVLKARIVLTTDAEWPDAGVTVRKLAAAR